MYPQVNSNPEAQFLISSFEGWKRGPRPQAADGVDMNHLEYSERQTCSPEALTELNSQELLQRIHAAETAIFLRLQGMRTSSIDLVEGNRAASHLAGFSSGASLGGRVSRYEAKQNTYTQGAPPYSLF